MPMCRCRFPADAYVISIVVFAELKCVRCSMYCDMCVEVACGVCTKRSMICTAVCVGSVHEALISNCNFFIPDSDQQDLQRCERCTSHARRQPPKVSTRIDQMTKGSILWRCARTPTRIMAIAVAKVNA